MDIDPRQHAGTHPSWKRSLQDTSPVQSSALRFAHDLLPTNLPFPTFSCASERTRLDPKRVSRWVRNRVSLSNLRSALLKVANIQQGQWCDPAIEIFQPQVSSLTRANAVQENHHTHCTRMYQVYGEWATKQPPGSLEKWWKVLKISKNGKGPGLSKMISERSRSRVQSQICTYGSQHFFCVKAKLILIIEGWKTLMWPVCCLRYRIYSMYHSMCSCSSIIPTTQMRRGLMWDEALIALIQPFAGFILWIGSCRCKCKSHQLRSWQRPS